jgi:hypothetical protein
MDEENQQQEQEEGYKKRGISVIMEVLLRKRQKYVQYKHAQYNPKRVIKHHQYPSSCSCS